LGDEAHLQSKKEGIVEVAFPVANTDFKHDGISHLLCQIMGGQLDIDIITKCHVLDLKIPKAIEQEYFLGPQFGIDGIRKFVGIEDKPLLGGIVKPKIGVTPPVLLEMVKQMVEGGINFIKEDEIMSNPAICPIEERVPLIMDYLKDKNVIYSVCINADPPYLLERAKLVHKLGGNSIHVNFWSGLGCYRALRELELPLFIHFQKSGDKILTGKNHDFHIEWDVVCDLAGLMGVDFIHAGMWGGYLSDNEEELAHTLTVLQDRGVMPALSCGMHPGLVQAINKRFGIDYMANVGGALHGHPAGTQAGTRAMRSAIDDKTSAEYTAAIEKWGLTE
jgi:ribulose-bisphosphate carboxylase large chain